MSTDMQSSRRPSPALVLAAFGVVYVIWGSTYLGIRIAIESIPPFLMAGVRFLLAGVILYIVERMRGVARPTAAQWKAGLIVGGMLIVGGNGGVTWAEQAVPSSIAALVVAAVPMWIVLFDWARPDGRRPSGATVAGLAVGFLGVLVLVFGKDPDGSRIVNPIGAAVLVFATLTWAWGSIYSRYAVKHNSALQGVGLQMMTGGGLLLLLGFALGEGRQFDLGAVTARSAWAFAYLVFLGSLLGFSAYIWLLQASTPAKVSTYAFVNPFIAVLLGYLILDETVSSSLLLAGALIIGAVVLITVPATRKEEVRAPEKGSDRASMDPAGRCP
jgi:drug/metabolite transporter (DMT)-like permease